MRLSIVIPAFNEEGRIRQTLQKIARFVGERGWDGEIIVVDDGSRDRTAEVVKEEFAQSGGASFLVLENGANRGKGYSVRRGVNAARGDRILFTDADLSTPIEEIDRLVEFLDGGFDVAMGSRSVPGSRVEIHQNRVRETMGKVFNCLARLLTFKGVHDSQCGFKLFKGEVAHRLFELARIDGFAFDAEIVYLAQKLGYKVIEVPVIWRNSTASKVHMVFDPVKMMWDLFRIRFYHRGHGEKKGF